MVSTVRTRIAFSNIAARPMKPTASAAIASTSLSRSDQGSSDPSEVNELPANTPTAVAATPPTIHLAVSRNDCALAAIAGATEEPASLMLQKPTKVDGNRQFRPRSRDLITQLVQFLKIELVGLQHDRSQFVGIDALEHLLHQACDRHLVFVGAVDP
ncbi:hypothetical protein [Mesorhizobium amorphae]|uniref:hypothetical protein n=1 Tax=Mesorhizobium amorphae TaxID=71433 RepID=UPI0021B1F585|nr:hypothetical protein [Mesorhizobium amorphae]